MGNSGIYVYLTSKFNLQWDFITKNWIKVPTDNCKVFLKELPDTDPVSSLYYVEIEVPENSAYFYHIVLNNGIVLKSDTVLLQDKRLDNLDVEVSKILKTTVNTLLRAGNLDNGIIKKTDGTIAIKYSDGSEVNITG